MGYEGRGREGGGQKRGLSGEGRQGVRSFSKMRTNVMCWGMLGLLSACGGAGQERPSPEAKTAPQQGVVGAPAGAEAATKVAATSGPVAPPSGKMKRQEAEKYVLALINRDRAAHGLSPVRWDETAAAAGRRHAADLAVHGVTAHFGTDGSVPEQRYTRTGGDDMVTENVGCFADGVKRELDPDPLYLAEALERFEQVFMNEVPPNDGHRRNILTPRHNAVGVGLAQAKGLDIACIAQEFLDDYGEYAPLPRRAKVGSSIQIQGKLRDQAKIAAVGISRVDRSRPKAVADLARIHGYMMPSPYVIFFPEGFKTKIILKTDRVQNKFFIESPLSDGNKPGLYGVSVWATFPGSQELVMVSLRTIDVD
jgi:uncharacterized protein YkwD